MRAIAGADWGGGCADLRGLYIAYVRSLIQSCSATFSPLLTVTRKKELEVIQNRAARIMTGCVKAAESNSVLMEANLCPLWKQFDEQAAIAAEKAARLPEGDPLQILANKANGRSRLVHSGESWKQNGDKTLMKMGCIIGRKLKNGGIAPLEKKDRDSTTAIDIRNREALLMVSIVPPWMTQRAGQVVFFTDLDCE